MLKDYYLARAHTHTSSVTANTHQPHRTPSHAFLAPRTANIPPQPTARRQRSSPAIHHAIAPPSPSRARDHSTPRAFARPRARAPGPTQRARAFHTTQPRARATIRATPVRATPPRARASPQMARRQPRHRTMRVMRDGCHPHRVRERDTTAVVSLCPYDTHTKKITRARTSGCVCGVCVRSAKASCVETRLCGASTTDVDRSTRSSAMIRV